MKAVGSLTRQLAARYWKEAVVLGGVILLDKLGWLPRLVPDMSAAGMSGDSTIPTRAVSLLVAVTLIWALTDELLGQRKKTPTKEK